MTDEQEPEDEGNDPVNDVGLASDPGAAIPEPEESPEMEEE